MELNMCRKVNFGIIGTGAISYKQHLPNMTRSMKINLKTACDINEDLLKQRCQEFGIQNWTTDYKNILNDKDIQGVVIGTREDIQAQLASEALKAGKHVYVEKPVAKTEEQYQCIFDAQKQTSKFLTVGFNRRFAPAYRKAKEIVKSLGGAKVIFYRLSDDYWLWGDHDRPARERIFFEVCHIFDIVRWFSDSDAESLYCIETRDDEEAIVIKMRNGCVCTILATSYATCDMPKEHVQIIAGKGGVIVDEFTELKSFGSLDYPPVIRYAGHTHPQREFTYKQMFEYLGMEAVYAMRRGRWENLELIRKHVKDSNVFNHIVWNSGPEEFLKAIEGDFPFKKEIVHSLSQTGAIAGYMVNKGWQESVENLAMAIQTGDLNEAATVMDSYKATQLAFAATESRESHMPVNIK